MKIGKKALLINILVWSASISNVHGQPPLAQQYPFLKTDENTLQYFGDTIFFNSFFEKLDSLITKGEGQLNIVHIGGSHVQGGVLSNTLRKKMQSLSPQLEGERGFLFPFRLAKTNNPWNYVVEKKGNWEGARVSVSKHQSHWGVSGITATTYSPKSQVVIYNREDNEPLQFNKVRIFYFQNNESFEPKILNDSIKNTTFDSTKNYMECTFHSLQDTLYLGFLQTHENQNQFILQGIQFLNDAPGIVYHAIGVNGASTDDYLRAAFFPNQMAALQPDCIILGIGINDANVPGSVFDTLLFRAHYQQLIDYFKAINPNVALLFLTNSDSFFKNSPNENALKVRRSMVYLAQKNKGAVWDLFDIMGGLGSIVIWEGYHLARSDKIHFTRKGYELQAALLFEALRQAFGDYLLAHYGHQP